MPGRSGKRRAGQSRPPTEGVSRDLCPPPARGAGGIGESLRVEDRGGISRTPLRPPQRCARVPVPIVEAAPLRRTPLYDLHRARGARMVAVRRLRDAGAVPGAASSPSTCIRARRPACSTSRIWARSRCAASDAARALEALVPGDLQGAGAGPHALHAAAERGRRHSRRSDGRRGIDGGLMLVVNAARKEADLAHLRRISATASTIEPQFERALLALAGTARRRGAGAARRPASRRMQFMSAAEADGRRRAVLCDPLRLYRRGRVRDVARRPETRSHVAEALLARAGGRADRARRPRYAAPRSRALPLRP